MKWNKWAVILFVLALPLGALAQGSGSVAPPRSMQPDSHSKYPERPFVVTRTIKGKVTKIDAHKRFIIVEDKKGKKHEFKLGKKLKLKAGKRTEFAGKKDIMLDDFETGQFVKVTYLASNNTATELRMIHALH